MNLWSPPYQRVALPSWAICLYFWTSLWELNPWKRVLQTLPITTLARDDGGYRGDWTLSFSITHWHAETITTYTPSHFREMGLEPITSSSQSKHATICTTPCCFSEDRGHAPQALSGSHYLAGRFWTFQIYLPFCLIKKLPRCLFW